MAENVNDKKYFLDLGGLKTLWNKISSTFANKSEVKQSVDEINTSIGELNADLQKLDADVNLRIDTVEAVVDTFVPKEYEDYTSAVNGVKMPSDGTVDGAIIKILNDSKHLGPNGEPIVNEDGTSPVYKAGLYLVIDHTNGVIEKISTASGSGVGGNIEEVATAVERLDREVVKGAFIKDAKTGDTLSEVNMGDNVLAFLIDNEFDINSNSVNALTHKAVAAMFGELTDQISKIPKFKIKVVDSLPNIDDPNTEISLSTIYLVKNGEEGSSNLFIEYICVEHLVDGVNTKQWERLGEQTLVINDFAKKEWVEDQIANAMKDVVKEGRLAEAIETAKGEILVDIEKTYVTKEQAENYIDAEELSTALGEYYTKAESNNLFLTPELANTLYATKDDIKDFMTEGDIITSIQSGNIGENIRITDEQINELTTLEI